MKEDTLILILGDDPDLCTMIRIMVEYKGYVAVEASNERDARQILVEQQIGLIILDMLLSGTDGTEVCRRIKDDKRHSAVPVLMFSAHPNAKEACLKAGADDFISKPFEMNDLLEKVEHFITRNAGSN